MFPFCDRCLNIVFSSNNFQTSFKFNFLCIDEQEDFKIFPIGLFGFSNFKFLRNLSLQLHTSICFFKVNLMIFVLSSFMMFTNEYQMFSFFFMHFKISCFCMNCLKIYFLTLFSYVHWVCGK